LDQRGRLICRQRRRLVLFASVAARPGLPRRMPAAPRASPTASCRANLAILQKSSRRRFHRSASSIQNRGQIIGCRSPGTRGSRAGVDPRHPQRCAASTAFWRREAGWSRKSQPIYGALARKISCLSARLSFSFEEALMADDCRSVTSSTMCRVRLRTQYRVRAVGDRFDGPHGGIDAAVSSRRMRSTRMLEDHFTVPRCMGGRFIRAFRIRSGSPNRKTRPGRSGYGAADEDYGVLGVRRDAASGDRGGEAASR